VLYLRASIGTLQDRISRRWRDYERQITPHYLEQLNTLYEGLIDRFTLCPVLTVPADDLDYVANARHLDLIAQKVLDKLQGKDEVVFAAEELQRYRSP